MAESAASIVQSPRLTSLAA